MTEDSPELDSWQVCEIPECRNEVPKSKGICDECSGDGRSPR